MKCKWCGKENGQEECAECLCAMGEVTAREWPDYVAYMREVNAGIEKAFGTEEAPYGLTAQGEFLAAGGSEYLLERYGHLIKADRARNWPERMLEAQIS